MLVLRGNEIPFFTIDNVAEYRELMQRAQSLTIAGTVEFRMCRVAASGFGLEPGDIHGFVKLVPMADAEVVCQQQEEGYVYTRQAWLPVFLLQLLPAAVLAAEGVATSLAPSGCLSSCTICPVRRSTL